MRRLRILTNFYEMTDNVTSSRALHLNVRQNIFKARLKINLKKNVLNLKMLHFHGIKNDHIVHLILICCYCSCAINMDFIKYY